MCDVILRCPRLRGPRRMAASPGPSPFEARLRRRAPQGDGLRVWRVQASQREETMNRHIGRLALAAAIGIIGTTWSALAADPPKSIRIGYAVSLSGVNAQGAAVTTLPAYKLWVDDVNKKGGLM